MKQAQILPAVMDGKKLVVGELLKWEAREFQKKNKDKQPIDGEFHVMHTATVLVGTEVIEVGSFANDKANPNKIKRLADWKRPAGIPDRSKVVVEFTNWQNDEQYGIRVKGIVSLLEP